jgi:replication fork protection complex subunit Csm3/Swi3
LNFYQLWLDDLFPRAKFADGLTMIERLGHSKRMQTMRREWIDEEKPKLFDDRDVSRDIADIRDLRTRLSFEQKDATTAGPKESTGPEPWQNESGAADPELFIPDPEGESRPLASHPEPDDDDLEDLLREQDETVSRMPEATSRPANNHRDDFDAEYEAMNELGM